MLNYIWKVIAINVWMRKDDLASGEGTTLAGKTETLESKLKVAVDYEKCHAEKCTKGVCAAVFECPARLCKQEEPYTMLFQRIGYGSIAEVEEKGSASKIRI